MIAVFASDESDLKRASNLAEKLSLPLVHQPDLNEDREYSMLLEVTSQGLVLCPTGKKRAGPTGVDFLSGAVAHRRQYGGGSGQLIAKACGVSGKYHPHIADLTAGLGRDAFVLASLGARVDMIERVPLVYELLTDGLNRGLNGASDTEREILNRMTVRQLDAVSWCHENPEVADVIYLDPMFPHSSKSAQVKKEMLAFRTIVGADEDSKEVLEAALGAARCRVVVKRARKAPAIEGLEPSYVVEGKSGRFDIYALRRLGSRD